MIHNAILFALLSSLGRALAVALARQIERGTIDEELTTRLAVMLFHAKNAREEADEELMVVLDEIMEMAQAVIRSRIEE